MHRGRGLCEKGDTEESMLRNCSPRSLQTDEDADTQINFIGAMKIQIKDCRKRQWVVSSRDIRGEEEGTDSRFMCQNNTDFKAII